jgi:hypothetical protein
MWFAAHNKMIKSLEFSDSFFRQLKGHINPRWRFLNVAHMFSLVPFLVFYARFQQAAHRPSHLHMRSEPSC